MVESSSANKKKNYDELLKLVVVGDAGVGKSCLLLRFADDTYTDAHISTIGVDFRFRNLKVDKKKVKLQIWDTAGQERFKTITSAYYRNADGIVLVYDVGSEESFNHIKDWLVEIQRYAPEGCAKILVGNKCDRSDILVPKEKAKAFAETLGIPFIETSAKESTNVEDTFMTISRDLLANRKERKESSARQTTSTSQDVKKITFTPSKKASASWCC